VKKWLPILAAVASGLLLFAAFPPVGAEQTAWVALVPLFIACAFANPRRAAGLGVLSGTVFFVSSLYWLWHVSVIGWLVLALYCALYFIPPAVLIASRRCKWKSRNRAKNLVWIFMTAAVWVASEYVRTRLFTGFSWNLLGVSQWKNLPLIQSAAWGGVYLSSALVVMFNAALAATVLQYLHGLRKTYRLHVEILAALFLAALVYSVGLHVILMAPACAASLRIALIQPNIPEVGNWSLADPDFTYGQLGSLTETAHAAPALDLVIWPETALPDCVRFSARSDRFVRSLTVNRVPLLVGSMDVEWDDESNPRYFNSTMLFDTRGDLLTCYHKQHLVLFGEYIPFDEKIPFINALTPISASFSAGRDSTLFRLPNDERPFSVLICFEDTMPYLARRAVRAGATWLVNQTNDSWFDPDSGSLQHLANGVFRAVENRVPMVRCANTGMTCAVDPYGRVDRTLPPRIAGFQIVTPAPWTDGPLTFYTRFGDLFAQTCLVLSAGACIFLMVRSRKK